MTWHSLREIVFFIIWRAVGRLIFRMCRSVSFQIWSKPSYSALSTFSVSTESTRLQCRRSLPCRGLKDWCTVTGSCVSMQTVNNHGGKWGLIIWLIDWRHHWCLRCCRLEQIHRPCVFLLHSQRIIYTAQCVLLRERFSRDKAILNDFAPFELIGDHGALVFDSPLWTS